MKAIVLILFLFPALVNAQNRFRPIIDPSILCNEEAWVNTKYHILNPLYKEKEEQPHKKYQIFYIVEKMPEPKISAKEIENMLGNVILLKIKEKTCKYTITIQCIVNCRGEAGDYQIMNCPAEFDETGCQLLKAFRTRLDKWEPGKQRGRNVDVLMAISVIVSEGKFEVRI